MQCTSSCTNTPVQLGNNQFHIDFYVLPISGADVVLGIQWLKTFGPIITDYKSLSMQFHWKGSTIRLSNIPKEVVSLVYSFKELFYEPQELPPIRSNTHHIKLLPASTPQAKVTIEKETNKNNLESFGMSSPRINSILVGIKTIGYKDNDTD